MRTEEPKDRHISFKVDDAMYDFIRQLANARMLSMSQLIRHLIVEMAAPEYQKLDLDRQFREIRTIRLHPSMSSKTRSRVMIGTAIGNTRSVSMKEGTAIEWDPVEEMNDMERVMIISALAEEWNVSFEEAERRSLKDPDGTQAEFERLLRKGSGD